MIWELQLPVRIYSETPSQPPISTLHSDANSKNLLKGPRIVHLKLMSTFVSREGWLDDIEARQSSSSADDHPPAPSFEYLKERKDKFPFVCACKARCSQKAPTILYVNRESRSVGMKVYTKTFGTLGRSEYTWFYSAKDSLYLDWRTIEDILELGLRKGDIGVDFSKVRRLLVAERPRSYLYRAKYKHLWAVLQWFAKLEHVTIVTEDPVLEGGNYELALHNFVTFGELDYLEEGYSPELDEELQSYQTKAKEQIRRRVLADVTGITEQREADIQEAESRYKGDFPELPVIDSYKLITTVAQEAVYEETLAEYMRQKERFRANVYLSTWGGDYLHFSASYKSTIENAIDAFRASGRYSKDKVMHLRYRRATLPPQMKIFDIPELVGRVPKPYYLQVIIENKRKGKKNMKEQV